MRLLFVQYAGDYREAVLRFAEGGEETYYAQKYSVNAVAEIAQKIQEAAVLCCITPEPYDEVLQNGVRAIGAGFKSGRDIQIKVLLNLIENLNPTHLIVCTPIREILSWGLKSEIKILPLFADSFHPFGLRNKWNNFLLSRLLNNPQIEWVANHHINSCISLEKIGVNPDKIIPWDFKSVITPENYSAKNIQLDSNNFNLLYVGSVTESKGVGDVLKAIAKLKANNLTLNLKIAGKGEIDYYKNEAKKLQIESNINFLGLVPHNDVVPLMRQADLILIPSRHEYPEGLPFTIYEALCSRTPIIASDNPMFQNNLKHSINAMIFPASDSNALAATIEETLSSPDIYHSISLASEEAWNQLQIPLKWAELINCWLDNSYESKQLLFEHRLSSGRYRYSNGSRL